MSDKKFPEGFYWGAATAAYQVEGGIENTDWSKAAREGRVPACGRAADHYHLFEQDFDIAKDLGHNCHRISIEWARIEPEEGQFNEAEIEHYRQVLAALRERRLKPFITLWHFTLPQWFVDKGGFLHKDGPEIFARYCGYVARKLGNDCRHFSTMNEPTVVASNGFRRGTWPPFRKWPGFGSITKNVPGHRDVADQSVSFYNVWLYFKYLRQLARAHNLAYDEMKRDAFGLEIGVVKHIIFFHANGNPLNKLIAHVANWHWTHTFLKRVYKKCDSIGVNYYLHKKFGDNATYPKTDMGWDVYTEGLCGALEMVKRYGKPIWVSEAGVADADDDIRADYIKGLIRCMHTALQNGADVRGFMYWSLLDNYEWDKGFEKRFGLVEINYDTLERKVRPSAYVYKKIIENNGVVE